MKLNKLKLIFSSIATLLPIPAGLVLWNRLPDSMTVHWNSAGTPDGTSSKIFAVFGFPLILLAIFWICIFFTAKDNKNRDQSAKAFDVVFWIIPAISCVVSAIMYAFSLGKQINVSLIMCILFGLIFIVIGNYMPKFRQNFTMGIKIKWTLENEQNWNATHRFAGKIWFAGGLIMLFASLFDQSVSFIIMMCIIALAVTLPVIYSFAFYKKQLREGTFVKSTENHPITSKKARIISYIVVAVIIFVTSIIMITGNIKVQILDDSFTVDSIYGTKLCVNYSDIDGIELRMNIKTGTRVVGFNNARVKVGTFQNSEFGTYTIYAHNGADSFVVIKNNDNALVIALETENQTMDFYKTIEQKISIAD